MNLWGGYPRSSFDLKTVEEPTKIDVFRNKTIYVLS